MSLLAMPFPMRVSPVLKLTPYRFFHLPPVQREEIGAALGIYGHLSRSANHNKCSSETGYSFLHLFRSKHDGVDVLAANCLLDA